MCQLFFTKELNLILCYVTLIISYKVKVGELNDSTAKDWFKN